MSENNDEIFPQKFGSGFDRRGNPFSRSAIGVALLLVSGLGGAGGSVLVANTDNQTLVQLVLEVKTLRERVIDYKEFNKGKYEKIEERLEEIEYRLKQIEKDKK